MQQRLEPKQLHVVMIMLMVETFGNDGADAAGIHMKLTFSALITTVATMGLMQPV